MSGEAFQGVIQEAIVSLPQDMKAILRILEDPDLEDDQRTLVAGALLHVLSGHNAIPGMRGILAYVDDVIMLRLVLARLEEQAPDVIARHREREPELFDPLDEQMDTVHEYLGELVEVLVRAMDGLPKLTHQGHSAVQCAHDSEGSRWLYDAVHEALVKQLDFDPDNVARTLKNVDQILPPLRQRKA
jgi:uncharacterized membrane protein YkvA (DUF1232 family)